MRQVVKLGGSLLSRLTLAADFRRWLADHPASRTCVVVGGGEVVEAIRRWDEIHRIDPCAVHWHCVDLMHLNVLWCQNVLGDLAAIADRTKLDRWLDGPPGDEHAALVSPRCFYHRDGDSELLPENWGTTSDSIAAVLARRIDADRLILLKSCAIDRRRSIAELTQAQVIDPELSRAITRLRFQGDVSVEQLSGDEHP